MTWVLDAGALIALERNDAAMWERIKIANETDDRVRTHGGVIAQVWRGGYQQARLARAMRSVRVVPLDESVGRAAGALLGASGQRDAIDAAVVAIANDADVIITSDVADITRLVAAANADIDVVGV